MNYFSIHNPAGEHLGFLIMLADDESAAQPQSGRFAVKVQSEFMPKDMAAVNILQTWENHSTPLSWNIRKERVDLFADDALIGSIRHEYLTLSGQLFVLNDLTGMM